MSRKVGDKYISGKADTDLQESFRNGRRYTKVLFKLIFLTVVNIVIAIVGFIMVNSLISLTTEQSGIVSLVKEVLNGTKNPDYAKYCYICLAMWCYAALGEFFLIVRALLKINCIANRDCLHCEEYLTCGYKDIKRVRNY